MKEYVIIAESGSDVTKEQQEKYNIYTVPMHVFFGEDCKDDGTFAPEEEFVFYKSTGIIPKSSGSNVDDFVKVYDKIHEERPNAHILHIAYSAITTVSYQSAVVAAENRDYVSHVDTKQVSAGQAYVIELVGRYMKEHPDAEVEEIFEYVEDIRDRTHMAFVPGDLDYLRAGGRVSNAAYIGAKILSIKPVIEIVDGALTGTKKYRGSAAKICRKLINEIPKIYNFSRDMLFFVTSPGFDETLFKELEASVKEMGFKETHRIMTGGVITSHSGPGGFGVIGLSEK